MQARIPTVHPHSTITETAGRTARPATASATGIVVRTGVVVLCEMPVSVVVVGARVAVATTVVPPAPAAPPPRAAAVAVVAASLIGRGTTATWVPIGIFGGILALVIVVITGIAVVWWAAGFGRATMLQRVLLLRLSMRRVCTGRTVMIISIRQRQRLRGPAHRGYYRDGIRSQWWHYGCGYRYGRLRRNNPLRCLCQVLQERELIGVQRSCRSKRCGGGIWWYLATSC